MPDLLVALVALLSGAWLGWMVRDLKAERDQDRAKEQLDAEWDEAHGIGDRRA